MLRRGFAAALPILLTQPAKSSLLPLLPLLLPTLLLLKPLQALQTLRLDPGLGTMDRDPRTSDPALGPALAPAPGTSDPDPGTSDQDLDSLGLSLAV